MSRVLGLDTSNYTTSVAVFEDGDGVQQKQLLPVEEGQLGLRQRDALFHHVRRLPALMEKLAQTGALEHLEAVGASTRPRPVEGSYMPCFLAGASQGQVLAHTLGIPFFPFSHQEGHLAAAAWSSGHVELLDAPFLAWHLSGGTTELLLAEPEGPGLRCTILGGTQDISAGQLIDRTGVALGLPFPAGRGLDELWEQGSEAVRAYPVRLNGLSFSLSGMENQVRKQIAQSCSRGDVARFALETIVGIVVRATQAARTAYPGLPVLCSGGVASNRRLRQVMAQDCGALFAQPEYSADNAMGVAILTSRALGAQEQTI